MALPDLQVPARQTSLQADEGPEPLGDRVVSGGTEGVAAQQPADAQPDSPDGAVAQNRLGI